MGEPIFINPYNGNSQKKKIPTSAIVHMSFAIANAVALLPTIIGSLLMFALCIVWVESTVTHVIIVFVVAYGVVSITALIMFIYNCVKGGIYLRRSYIITGISAVVGVLLGNLLWYLGPAFFKWWYM